jgi:hypothetical protein
MRDGGMGALVAERLKPASGFINEEERETVSVLFSGRLA